MLKNHVAGRKVHRGSVLTLENALVGPHVPKSAVGGIEEVAVRCWQDDGCIASACSSVCESISEEKQVVIPTEIH
jgi:hypothetical protein